MPSGEALLGMRIVDDETIRIGEKTFSLRDLVGIRAVKDGIVEVSSCPVTAVSCLSRGERRLRKDLVNVANPVEVATEVRTSLRGAYPASPKRALVIVNPKGGVGNAQRVFERDVKPVLDAADVKYEILVTSRRREAMERCEDLAAERFESKRFDEMGDDSIDCVVVVGGDGTVWEVVKGLWDGCRDKKLFRTESLASNKSDVLPMQRLDQEDDVGAKLSTIPIGHIPAGSGNALAESIARSHGDQCTPVDAAYAVVKGTVIPVDLAEYDVDGTLIPSFLSFEWAMLADVDLGSESMRCLGDLRFHLAAIHRICCLKRYEGTLSYLPLTNGDFAGDDNADETKWVVLDATNFHLLVATNLSHLDASTPMAPRALPDDGALHLVWTTGGTSCSDKFHLLQGLLKLDEGKHIESPFVHTAKCRAFRLDPAPNSQSRAAIDGEEVPNKPIRASIRPSALRVFASPPRLNVSTSHFPS